MKGIGTTGTLELRAVGTSDHIGGLVDDIQMYELGDPSAAPVVPEFTSLVRVSDNLLVNSSLESQLSSEDGWKLYDYLEGWTTVNGPGIEVQQNIFGAAADGLKIVELDSAGNSAMAQNVRTEAGKLYEVSIQYSPRPGVRETSNAIEVLWNGVHVETLSANGEGLTHVDWSEYRLMVEGDGTIGTLEFRALGASDHFGGFLDNIQMFELGTGPKADIQGGPVEDPNGDAVEVIELDDFGNPLPPQLPSVTTNLVKAGENLVANGSFENGIDSFSGWRFFESIEGWSVSEGTVLELQQGLSGPAADGATVLELDADVNSAVRQTIRTDAGATYELNLKYSPRPGFNAESNGVEILWNGVHVGTVTADGSSLTQSQWLDASFLLTGDGSTGTLEFRALGTSDAHGGLIDAVSVYQLVEPGTVIQAPSTDGMVYVSGNLVVNGSFESQLTSEDGWKLYQTLEGWTTVDGPGIEVQQNIFGAAADGLKIVELDSAGNSAMAQNVHTEAGKLYEISLQYSPRPGVTENSNAIEVVWNGVHVDTLSASGEGLTHVEWSEYRFTVEGDGTVGTLEFRAQGASDYVGGFLDNVKMHELGFGQPVAQHAPVTSDELPVLETDMQRVTSNLLSNASFENSLDTFTGWQHLRTIEGWNVTQGDFVEVQRIAELPAADGLTHVELDSNQNSGISQVVNTQSGKSYELALQYSPRPGLGPETLGIEILWNGTHVYTLTADGSNLTSTEWLPASFMLQGDGPTGTLEFRAVGTGDHIGGLIDNIQLYELA